MAGIKDYSTTQANNTDLNGISVAEGMLPSNLNNAIRALMKNTREWFNDSQWVEYGDGSGAYTATYASSNSFTIAGVDVTPIYHEGRRIKLTATTPGTIYGTISSSTFSTNTTITVTWDSGSLSNETIDNVYIGALSKTNNSLPTGIIATATLADGSVTTIKIADSAVTTAKINDAAVTNAKLGADSVNGSKIADDSIDSEHYVDGSIDTAHIADSQITTVKIADSNVTTAKLATNAVTTTKITDANVTSAKIATDAVDGTKIADDSIDSEHYVDGSIDTAHIADSQITNSKMAVNSVDSDQYVDGSIDTVHIGDSQITTDKINNDAVTSDKIADAVIVTNAEQSGHTPDDVTFFTTSASDGRYFRQDSSETIDSGDTWSASDSFIATTAAIDARVIDLVDDVGGFFPIADETNFPNTNPDVNDGAGTIVSIKEMGTTRTPSGGTVTISGGTVGGSTVTITGCGSTVLTAGFGVLVETTTTLNTYTFHRLVPKATEVTTVASISSDITTVANDTTDIGTVATDLSGSDNIGTVATNITNVNLVGGSITNVNLVGANITSVNSFAERYRVDSSDPTTSLDEGDLAFNTTDNNLKFYDGTSWTSIAPGIANVVDDASPQLGGDLDLNSSDITGTGNVNITGSITSTSFSGDGSSLTSLNIVTDTTPQLGGNLDLNSNDITGTGNINITGTITATTINGTIGNVVEDTTPQLGGQLDVNGNAIGNGTEELIKFIETASAVNEVTITNSATGNAPEISATGDDTNIDFKLTPKGSGNVVLDGLKYPNADGTADQVLKTDGSGNLSFTDVSGGTSWQSVKTSGFTAVSGEGYPCDTSSSAFTVTLPSSANIGDYVVIADYGSNASSNNITIDANGSKILGSTGNRKIQTNKEAIKLVYIDATKGWIGASGYVEGTLGLQGVPDAPTIGTATATGNTTATVSFTAPTNNGDSTITSYTATSNPSGGSGTLSQAGSGTISVTGLTGGTSYTFTVTATNSIGTSVASAASNSITTPNTYSADMLIIAGGGGGGAHYYGGGGGAGGYRTSTQSLTGGTTYTITVGDGGAGSGVNNTRGGNGSDSSISGSGITTITSTGGGGGGSGGSTPNKTGKDGGSGGGSAYDNSSAGSGNTPSTSPSQGNNGGLGFNTPGVGNGGGGGGGAGSVGQAGYAPNNGGNGGNGLASSITGSSVTRAGGGGGAAAGGTNGSGGTGGGGNAGSDTGGSGTVNTGSGGGGQGNPGGGGSGDGGKGVVILSVLTANYSGTTTGSPTVTTSGSNTIMQFNGSGSYTA